MVKCKEKLEPFPILPVLHSSVRVPINDKYMYNVFIFLSTVIVILGSSLVPIVDGARVWKCSVCKTIADDFTKGLKETAKSNYGGGNTNWEEKALGSYAKSEIRLVEIMEYLCKGGDKECHYMLEEHEDLIETFWYKEYGKKENLNFFNWICVENIKTCCPENTFGENCSACQGGIKRPCTGNGKCDGGGTRQGKGTCDCHNGYTGDLCDDCVDGHYEGMKNETHTVCKKCHDSCKSLCWQAGPQGCDDCKDGYELIDETCTDINECETGSQSCVENKMCVNNEGSYMCIETTKDDQEANKDTENTQKETNAQEKDESEIKEDESEIKQDGKTDEKTEL